MSRFLRKAGFRVDQAQFAVGQRVVSKANYDRTGIHAGSVGEVVRLFPREVAVLFPRNVKVRLLYSDIEPYSHS
jgi:hypothetical protein